MPKKTNKEEPEIETQNKVSKNQHMALNNLNMIMYWIRKKHLSEEQLINILNWTHDALSEIKKV